MKVESRASLLLACLLVPAVAGARSVESVFQEAARYTVKIETSTEHPFLGDRRGTTFGAGFLVDREKGWILTNRHVVAEAPSLVDVRFLDSDYVAAEKLYLDPQVDLALIRIPPSSIPDNAVEARLGCYEAAQMGNAVVIFGHPSGLNFTGTRGIISGTTFVGGNESLQTDAPLNSGNSGGPLINIDSGRVVGVSEARYDAEESEGLNLTVSIDHACKIISLLEAGNNPSPPAMPIVFVEHDNDRPRLVVANAYYEDRALLQTGDVIVGISGEPRPISNIDQLKFLLRGRSGQAELVIERDGRRMRVSIPLEPEPYLLDRRALTVSGMTLLDYQPVDRIEGGFDDRVIVVNSAEGSIAYDSWFEAWDSVYTIDGRRVNNIDEAYDLLAPYEDGEDPVSIIVRVRSDNFGKLFDYHELYLRVRNLQILRNPGH
ncbi:MAG: trypsin-like peptidase domain-containing protein [Gammaproteobacteria bacterium]